MGSYRIKTVLASRVGASEGVGRRNEVQQKGVLVACHERAIHILAMEGSTWLLGWRVHACKITQAD